MAAAGGGSRAGGDGREGEGRAEEAGMAVVIGGGRQVVIGRRWPN